MSLRCNDVAIQRDKKDRMQVLPRTDVTPAVRLLQSKGFELRFQSLFTAGRALSFPCNDGGHVELDALSERARMNYLYARAVVGREFAFPVVQRSF